eukprot:GHVQ01002052.1.p1 GENE.GHVQ01002052.1~~GHVQ01002052.1.p1  ORF type:complete len:228 (+),score=21.75 GHVQ01002052.1:238-921(+)
MPYITSQFSTYRKLSRPLHLCWPICGLVLLVLLRVACCTEVHFESCAVTGTEDSRMHHQKTLDREYTAAAAHHNKRRLETSFTGDVVLATKLLQKHFLLTFSVLVLTLGFAAMDYSAPHLDHKKKKLLDFLEVLNTIQRGVFIVVAGWLAQREAPNLQYSFTKHPWVVAFIRNCIIFLLTEKLWKTLRYHLIEKGAEEVAAAEHRQCRIRRRADNSQWRELDNIGLM